MVPTRAGASASHSKREIPKRAMLFFKRLSELPPSPRSQLATEREKR